MNPRLKSTHSRSAAMLVDAFWLKCSSSLSPSFLTKKHISFSFLLSLVFSHPSPESRIHISRGCTAVGAPRSRRCKFATCRRIAAQPSAVSLPSYRGALRKARERGERRGRRGGRGRDTSDRALSVGRLFSDDVFAYRPVYI